MKDFQKGKKTILLSVAAALLMSGCSSRTPKAPMNEKPVVEVAVVEDKSISLSVVDMPVRKLMQNVCEAQAISCDFSVQPSDKYAVTFNYNGSVEGLLSVVKRQTGLHYKIIDGMITIQNKDDITQYEDPLKKVQCDKTITVSFKNMSLSDAFKYFYDEFGYSFNFDLRHTAFSSPTIKQQSMTATTPALPQMPILASTADKSASPKVSKTDNIAFYYNGCDPREALASFLSSLDLTMTEVHDNEFKIRDYDVAIVDKSVYFNYSMSSGGTASSGSTGASSGAASGGMTAPASSSSTGNSTGTSGSSTVSISENHRQDMEAFLRRYLSENGKLDFSMRGYVVVEDKPSYIKRVKAIINKEIEKEAPLSISINIVRVDLNDNYKAGVDWNAVWSKGLFGLRNLTVTSSMAGLVNGGFSFSGAFKGTDQVLTMLQDYGNTKIERSSTISARSGFLANYEATKPIPYVTTSSTVSGTSAIAQTAVTPLYEQEGFTLNILPNLNLEDKIVDLGIDVTVAEYAGDKTFDLGSQGIFTIPVVPKDKGKFAVQARLGETVILTGFKVKKNSNNKSGIPGLSQITGLGALFGYQQDADETSEILIILKVDQVKRQGS